MKLWEKVNNLTGYSSKSRVIVELLNQSSKFLVASLPERYLWSVASEEVVTGQSSTGTGGDKLGTGSGTAYDKIIAVYRFDGGVTGKRRVATEAPDDIAYSFDESPSLMRATKMFPKYYRLADRIYIKPDPDYNDNSNATYQYNDIEGDSVTVAVNSGDKGIIIYAAPPLVDENTSSWVLVEFEHVALLYAASLDAKRKSDLAAVEDDFELATVFQSQSQDFYQRFISEFQAASGGLAAPPQQQESHRQEQGAAT